MKSKSIIFMFVLAVMLFSIMPVQASTDCRTCHSFDVETEGINESVATEQAKWSEAMKQFAALADQKVESPYQYKMGRSSEDCFDTSGLSPGPIYTKADLKHDANLPLSDMIEDSPGAMVRKVGESTPGFLTHGPPTDRLCN